MKTGIQISSLKPMLTNEAQMEEAFAKMAAMGVRTVQLQWIDPSVPIPFIADRLKRYGIESVSVQDFYQTILENKDYYYDLNAATGGEWMCVSRVPERLKSPEGLEAYAAELTEMQVELEKLGQKLCFHPVFADYQLIGGVCPVDYLMEELPWLHLAADLYHLHRTGADMPSWLRRYKGRICMVHFKEGKTLPDGTSHLVPAGQGDIDWTGTVRACLDAQVPYAFAEQESWDRDPYVCLGEALDWIRKEINISLT